jgi:hypothetical protein
VIDGKRLVRELPLGLGVVAIAGGIALVVRWIEARKVPRAVVPAPGETLTGEAARRLHPPVPPPAIDRNQFATLPPECGCVLGDGGRAQLLMHVKGSQHSITDRGSAQYILHDVAVAREVDGGERLLGLPVSDDVAPSSRTAGSAIRLEVGCDGTRLVVADRRHATMWDLAGDRARKLWSVALATPPEAAAIGSQLEIACVAAPIAGGAVTVEEGAATVRLQLADGARASQ